MCDYCGDSGKLLTTCNKCYGNSDRDMDGVEYRWTCDKCNGNGYLEIACPVCKSQ